MPLLHLLCFHLPSPSFVPGISNHKSPAKELLWPILRKPVPGEGGWNRLGYIWYMDVKTTIVFVHHFELLLGGYIMLCFLGGEYFFFAQTDRATCRENLRFAIYIYITHQTNKRLDALRMYVNRPVGTPTATSCDLPLSQIQLWLFVIHLWSDLYRKWPSVHKILLAKLEGKIPSKKWNRTKFWIRRGF